jgi:1,4-alpha-glucan branching enzyme
VQWLLTADGLRRDAVRAMVTADGTHAQWLCHEQRSHVEVAP